MIETGTTLQQRYKIDKQIGQGGMGAVYVATDSRFGSTVAIKETLCMDANFRKAIEREARLLNSLKHSALPRVSDHFEENDGQFLVMEYIAGEDLCCILDERGEPFPVEQVMKWADQLLDALDYLHNQDVPVIHRDIKPQNLKITPRGEIILLDFGLAKGNPTDASHQTAAKSIFGYSRNYASLEQIQGTGTDPRSDLYSLAATLYHLLTNAAPEDALTRAMSVLSQSGDPLLAANAVNRKIPRGVAGVLQKALDLNASERPASAVEMRQMLRESENYGYLAEPKTATSLASDPGVFAQATMLMPDETHAVAANQTDIKTEVQPGNLSAATSVRAATATGVAAAHMTSGPAQKRRGFVMAAAALTVLVAGGAVAGGVYVFNPSVFGIGQNAEKTPDTVPPPANSNTVVDANVSSIQIGSPGTAGEGNSSPAANDANRQSGTTEKPAETTKNNKASGAEKPKPQSADIPNPPDPNSGGVVITERNNNGTTTTRVYPNRPPSNAYDPFPRGFDPGNLTPEQRRRLKNIMRNNPRPPGNYPQRPPS